MKQPDLNCPHCNGTGAVDSGGCTPWDQGIEVPCGCLKETRNGITVLCSGKPITSDTVDAAIDEP